ncbi:hypothetical protein D8Y22_01990 [Salinadaptatus halalkaliphilus]|uniref:Uncharacterized protein n=1 Tax=Salinadaptatus halalkaliphilus TaxID=2419781 RepID=A0A4S3TQ51_9EURY|nr:hypothetical protein D8Y22_01990 [Salinadaptatus halalkaliphilus]
MTREPDAVVECRDDDRGGSSSDFGIELKIVVSAVAVDSSWVGESECSPNSVLAIPAIWTVMRPRYDDPVCKVPCNEYHP